MDKSKREKSPWVKSKKKPGPKKRKKKQFDEGQLKNLAESDKGSWFDGAAFIRDDDEVPSTSLAIAGASRLKIEVSMKKSDDDSAESSSENEETTDDPVWTVVDRQILNDHLEKCTLCRFCKTTYPSDCISARSCSLGLIEDEVELSDDRCRSRYVVLFFGRTFSSTRHIVVLYFNG